METIFFLIVLYVVWLIYKGAKKDRDAKKPENIILDYEREAEERSSLIRNINKTTDSAFNKPLPGTLMTLERLERWYNRISEIDKHDKEEAVKDAIDWKDAVEYVNDQYYYHLKCYADVDENDMKEVGKSGMKLAVIERRWANKLGEKNIEKYWEEEDAASREESFKVFHQ